MKKIKSKEEYVDENGVIMQIDYTQIRGREDLVYQTRLRRLKYYRLFVSKSVLDEFKGGYLSDRAFRIFCYIGGKIVYNNISYINGKDIMALLQIDRRLFYSAISELKRAKLIREIEFHPSDKSDRIFLVNPAYFWDGGPNRLNEVAKWRKL